MFEFLRKLKIRTSTHLWDKPETDHDGANRLGADLEPNEPDDAQADPMRFNPNSQPFDKERKSKTD